MSDGVVGLPLAAETAAVRLCIFRHS